MLILSTPPPTAPEDGPAASAARSRPSRRGGSLVLLASTALLALVTGLLAPPATAATITAAVTSNGVAGWGRNLSGQSVAPAGLTDVTAVSAGPDWSLALRGDGTVTAWGYNGTGQIDVPAGLTGVTAIGAGLYHGLALKNDGTVVAWGDNTFGQTSVPAGLAGVTAIAAGRYFSLALKNDGTVIGWGSNSAGQIDVPAGLAGVTAIAAGSAHALALTSAGTVTAWGENRFGQATVPTGLAGVTAIAAGGLHSLAVTGGGAVIGWGSNASGQLAVPAGLADVTAVSAGGADSLALRSDGTLAAWGDNRYGQTNVPTGIAGVTAISTSESHNLAVGPLPVLMSDAPPTTAIVGTSVSYSFAANTAAVIFLVASGSLPDGLTLSPAGVLSGTPTTPGDSTFTVAAQNSFGATEGASHTVTVETAAAAPTVSGDPGPGTVGTPYDFSYTVTGSPAPQVFVLSGQLPPGLSLDTAGRLTGTPTAPGTYPLTVRAENASGVADTISTITIATADIVPAISGDSPNGTVGSSYDYGYAVSGSPTPTVSVTSGALPPGLSLSAAGRVSGTPTLPGTYGFTVSAVSSAGSAEVVDSITIATADIVPAISGVVAAGMVGSAYDYSYTVTGSPTPTVSVVSGTLPPGLTLDAAGRLAGTPTVAGTYSFTVRAENSAGFAQATSTLTVSPQKVTAKADLRVDLVGPSSAVKGKTFTYTVSTTNAGPATSMSVYSKVFLPSNMQFVSATGKYTRIGNIVVFQRSTLTNGQTVAEKITVKATDTGREAALATTFSTRTPDPVIRSNFDTVSTTVR